MLLNSDSSLLDLIGEKERVSRSIEFDRLIYLINQ